MNTYTRILSVVMAVVMAVAMLPLSALANALPPEVVDPTPPAGVSPPQADRAKTDRIMHRTRRIADNFS